jgi:cytochrome c oxidase subunit 2
MRRPFGVIGVVVMGVALLPGASAPAGAGQDLIAAQAPHRAAMRGGALTSTGAAQAPAPRTIEIVAKRFEFVPSRVEVARGDSVRLVVKSADGVHGIAIRKFKVNRPVLRGETVTIDFVASEAGEFPIICSEECGDGHARMKGTLVVTATAR